MKNIFTTLILLILLSGCDPQGDIEFTVINSTENTKRIILEKHSQIDTFNIKPNDTTQIYYEVSIGGVMETKENIRINELFDTLYSNDRKLTKNLQNINNWMFNPEIVNESKNFVSGGINRFEFYITSENCIELEQDTFVSKGNQIVLIAPTEEELEYFVKYDTSNYAVNAAYDDFSSYANKVASEFEGTELSIVMPIEDVIEIIAFDNTKSYVNRKEVNIKYGFILNSNKREPIVEFGIFTDDYLIEKVNFE